MIDPLAIPPVGSRSRELQRAASSSPARGGGASRVAAFLDEARGFVDSLDVRRIGWATVRCLPAFAFARTRAHLFSLTGCRIESGTAVTGYVQLVGPRDCARNLRIGAGCILGPDVTFCLDAPITLGKNVSIGPRAVLYTATHALGSASRRMEFTILARPIVVEDGAWVGLGATILGGVSIGKGAVVSAGAVVNQDVAANTLVAGNPATVVSELPER